MDPISPMPTPDPADVATVQQVQQYWNSGNQAAAVDALRPHAQSGHEWATALLAWLLMQQGPPGLEESVKWATVAAQSGNAAPLVHTTNNLLAHLPSNPQLAQYVPELLALGLPSASGIDLVGQGWNLISQGQAQLGLQLMCVPVPAQLPVTEPQLNLLVKHARTRTREVDEAAAAARRSAIDVEAVASEAKSAIEKARDDLETSAKQAGLLVTAASSDATNSLFKADAKRNARESRGAWTAGLVVLGAAAVVAVLPVLLHYLGVGSQYSALEQIGLHLVSTAALATFAGVLLARARARDQAAQRANDLSTAMGTMISYSNQISDPAEKQRFMTMMGQVVLQAHLTSGTGHGAKDDSVSGMIALANLIKPSALPSAASQAQG